MNRSTTATRDLALIGVFAAMIAAFALVPAIPVGIGVPITLQTLAVALTGLVLGPVRGFLATLLYLAVGLAGLPVFAGGGAGLGSLAKPSAGYLVSFPIAAFLIGVAASIALQTGKKYVPAKLVAAALVGSILAVHPLGIAGLMINARMDLGKAFATDVVFWPGDLIKSVLAALTASIVLRAFPLLADRRARVVGAQDRSLA